MMPSIYLLIDPRTAEVRYVGWTGRTLQARLSSHFSEAYSRRDSHKNRWLRLLLAAQMQPVICLLETTTDYQERERYWIAHYRAAGCRLTNTTDGGDGALGHVMSAETRQKLSRALTGIKKRPMSGDLKEVHRRNATGRLHTKEAKDKVRAARLGKKRAPFSEEWRARIGAKIKGRQFSPASLAKIDASNKSRSKLTPDDVRTIRQLHAAGEANTADLMARFSASKTTICGIVRGERRSDVI